MEDNVRAVGYLREAERKDMELLYRWVNDSAVRKSAFSSEKISYEEHADWFCTLLQRKDCKQYIYMRDNEPIGQVRITSNGDAAEIDYSICLEKRRMGYGKEMIGLLSDKIRTDFPQVKILTAKVKPENVASQKVFLDAGYTQKYCFYEKKAEK